MTRPNSIGIEVDEPEITEYCGIPRPCFMCGIRATFTISGGRKCCYNCYHSRIKQTHNANEKTWRDGE